MKSLCHRREERLYPYVTSDVETGETVEVVINAKLDLLPGPAYDLYQEDPNVFLDLNHHVLTPEKIADAGSESLPNKDELVTVHILN